jgi:hypothetical protein
MIVVSAIVAAGLYTAIGLGVVYVAVKWLGFREGATALSVFFAPLVAYLIFSGQLAGFSGFGVELKFREASQRAVAETIDARKIQPDVEAAGEADMDKLLMVLSASPVLLLTAHDADLTEDQLTRLTLRYGAAIYTSLTQGEFEMLVVVDRGGRFLGSFPKAYFLDLLRIPFVQYDVSESQGAELSRSVRQGLQHTELRVIVKTPRQRAEAEGKKEYVVEQASNLDALKTMAAARADAIVVTGTDGRYKGFVRRRDLIDQLVFARSAS